MWHNSSACHAYVMWAEVFFFCFFLFFLNNGNNYEKITILNACRRKDVFTVLGEIGEKFRRRSSSPRHQFQR